MAQRREPSYTDLVYEVMRSARRPLRFQEIFDEVHRRRPVTTRNPRGTIRHVLGQGKQLISLGEGLYGYLPYLVEGSVLRVPLTEKKPARYPLTYPDEVRHALWPGFFDGPKRGDRGPAQVRLPTGSETSLGLEFLGPGEWGSQLSEELSRYLIDNRAAGGDSLLIRIGEGGGERAELWFEPRRKRDDAAVTQRNRELADAAEQILDASRSDTVFMWELVVPLLAKGLYQATVAPDELVGVLSADERFINAGLHAWALIDRLTPDTLDRIREWTRVEGELLQAMDEVAEEEGELPSPNALRYSMERVLADLGALLEAQDLESVDEANAFLQAGLSTGAPPRRVATSDLDRAQELMYDAWEASSSSRRVRLAREALRISPDCADAYVLLAEETAQGPQQAARLYAEGVAAGERALGKEAFVRDVGYFWGMLETRPYMRARLGLAFALWSMGKQQEAIEHAWEMLRLNPGDNQGVRSVLLGWLLGLGDDAQVKRVLDRYREDASAVFGYARALHAFRTGGDTKRARRLLAQAKQWNPHVPAYLLGKKRLPRRLPELIGFGDISEAVYCAAEQGAAWRDTPGALTWLAAQAS